MPRQPSPLDQFWIQPSATNDRLAWRSGWRERAAPAAITRFERKQAAPAPGFTRSLGEARGMQYRSSREADAPRPNTGPARSAGLFRLGPDPDMRVEDPPRVGEFMQVVDVPGAEIECPVPVVLKRGQREMGRIGTCVPMGGETHAVEFEHPLRIAQMLPGSRHPRFVPCGRSRPCTDTCRGRTLPIPPPHL